MKEYQRNFYTNNKDATYRHAMEWCIEDNIVISGISGRFPECVSVQEFMEKLLQGIDMVNEENNRWPKGLNKYAKRIGELKDASRFDSLYFGVNAKQVNYMDPQMRLLLETTYEAVIDAGINPIGLRGSKTGVFVASSSSDSMSYMGQSEELSQGYAMLGTTMSHLANRLSFFFDFKGPSFALDTSCSGSFYGLQQAITAIRTGACENAVVAASNLVFLPTRTAQWKELKMLSRDGVSRPFSENSDGIELSDAVVSIFLQKSRVAKRSYAKIRGIATSHDGYKEDGMTVVSYEDQKQLLYQLLEKGEVDADQISYVEAHATGTKVADSTEVNALSDVLCEDRKEPLLIGSVKSNMGNSEAASGLCSIVKVLIAMETGVIPPNLRYDHKNKNIKALHSGLLKVVTEPTKWKNDFAIVNSIGLAGSNAMVLLQSNFKQKKLPTENLPRLIRASGRTQDAVNFLLTKATEFKNDDEFLSLLDNLHCKDTPGHPYRGYAVLTDNDVVQEVTKSPGDSKRPLWYVFAGMGSQWPGMTKDLLKIPIFKATIEKLDKRLKLEGFDIYNALLSEDPCVYDSITNTSVAITSIQIGLVNLLQSIGVRPDGIIGHSAGETACAYADGCLSAEETVLLSYWKGKSLEDTPLPKGAMAALGLSREDIAKRLPEGVYIACHNSSNSTTISGLPEAVDKFVKELQAENIFARGVSSSGCAYHTKFIADAGAVYKDRLEKVLSKKTLENPKLRTKRWVSTCFPESEWYKPEAQNAGPSYQIQNLLQPVLFHEAMSHIAENAILLEIAPHTLMQAILKRALPKTTILGMAKRNHKDNAQFCYSNIGKLYTLGVELDLTRLLHPTTYPVSRGTPMLQSLIQWDHSMEWMVPDFSDKFLHKTGCCEINIDLNSEQYNHLSQHLINNQIIIPPSEYIIIAWKTLAKLHRVEFENFPIAFKDVEFSQNVKLSEKGSIKVKVSALVGQGIIQISTNDSVIMKAKIISANEFKNGENGKIEEIEKSDENEFSLSNKNDIDLYFENIGYSYGEIYRNIEKLDTKGNENYLKWTENYSSHINGILQCILFSKLNYSNTSHIVNYINKICINPKTINEYLENQNKNIQVKYLKNVDLSISAGVEIIGAHFKKIENIPPVNNQIHRCHLFVSYMPNTVFGNMSKCQVIDVVAQIVVENNCKESKINVLEYGKDEKNLNCLILAKSLESVPSIRVDANVTVVTNISDNIDAQLVENGIKVVNELPKEDLYHLVVLYDNIDNELIGNVLPGGFILLQFAIPGEDPSGLIVSQLNVVFSISIEDYKFKLLRKKENTASKDVLFINENSDKWIEELKEIDGVEKSVSVVIDGKYKYVVPCCQSFKNTRLFIYEENEIFSLNDELLKEQIEKGLKFNVYKNGQWGSYKYVNLENEPSFYKNSEFASIVINNDTGSLQWVEQEPFYGSVEEGNNELCDVCYASVDDFGVNKNGLVSREYAGYISDGRKVFGISQTNAIATKILSQNDYTWDVPSQLTLRDASSVPVAYYIALYALKLRGKLTSKNSILVFEGCNPVSYAVISIASFYGCQIFVTTKNETEAEFLMKEFSQLNNDNIINENSSMVEYVVMKCTNGRGVDIIFNPTNSKTSIYTFQCLKNNGKFIDLFSEQKAKDPIGFQFGRNVSYQIINPDCLFESDFKEKSEMYEIFKTELANGSVRPLPSNIFSNPNDIVKCSEKEQTVMKTILEITPKGSVQMKRDVKAFKNTFFNRNKSYIIIGEITGFGLELCKWMSEKGAYIVLSTPTNCEWTTYHDFILWQLEQKGSKIPKVVCDCFTAVDFTTLIKTAEKFAPVGGIFNIIKVASNTSDVACEKVKDVSESTKIIKELDSISRSLCDELEQFVLISLYPDQSSYVRNAEDYVCEARKSDGLPGLSLHCGVIENSVENKSGVVISQQSLQCCFKALDIHLQNEFTVVSTYVPIVKAKDIEEDIKIKPINVVADILGVKEIENVNPNSTLGELGTDSLTNVEIQEALFKNFNITLYSHDVPTLTLKNLLQFEL